MQRIETEVLIVGAGPVGLTLGMDLARRGIAVTLAEARAAGAPPSGRCNVVSARTMEAFRCLGIARDVRDAGLPADYPNDVAIRQTATGREVARIPIPCRRDRYTATDGPDTWWPTPEPPHRINQIYLEPVLYGAAVAMQGLRILHCTHISCVEQHEHGVLATAGECAIAARYLVGCDGAHSTVRRGIGVALSGDAAVIRARSTYIHAPALLGAMPGAAWAIDCIDPRHRGLVFAIDGRERWVVHEFAELGECLPSDHEQRIRDILGVPDSFALEILGQDEWVGRRLIANRFREGRIFLCGDAAHIWAPFGAYGMNAGIADAMNLSWMLAAVLNGWASPALLNAYDIERRPIADQVSRHAMRMAASWITRYEHADRPAYDVAVGGHCCGGLNFGYCYEGSPIIAYDGEAPPGYTVSDFVQSTVPGCRTPHAWLRDGRSLYDALGSDFSLLRLDPAIDVTSLVAAAAQRDVPMQVLDVDGAEAARLYPCKLLLSRPDRHVAWRGDAPPDDAVRVIDLVRGA